MPSGKSDLIDITGELAGAETEKALLFNDGARSVWLPRSQIEISEADNGLVEVTMPEWLALEKGLI